jgi:hypothetical protein
MLGEVHRSCLRSEFVRGVAAERYRLAQVVYGQCPFVERPSRCWLFHCCHLNLTFAVAVVASTDHRITGSPRPRSSLQNPSFCAFDCSRKRRGGTMAPCAQRPASAICGAAGWGFSAADALAALEEGVANTWGSCDRSTRVILANSVPHVEVNPRRPWGLLFGRSGGRNRIFYLS